MVLSNEPGYYKEQSFGVRLENMLLVRDAGCGFLDFETISLVPFDGKFIDKKLLTNDEMSWLHDYYCKILAEISQDLPEDVFSYLLLLCTENI
jgi:Xaa-Pro aminopeptidase